MRDFAIKNSFDGLQHVLHVQLNFVPLRVLVIVDEILFAGMISVFVNI